VFYEIKALNNDMSGIAQEISKTEGRANINVMIEEGRIG
jgi:hypothetical protein